MRAEGEREIDPAAVDVLTDGCGRGFTVLCTIRDMDLLAALAAIAGPTGLLIAADREPPAEGGWRTVRCVPALGIPVRSHVVDAAVIVATADLADVAEEVRRVLVPGGDVRVLLSEVADVEAALRSGAIEPMRQEAGVLVARGP